VTTHSLTALARKGAVSLGSFLDQLVPDWSARVEFDPAKEDHSLLRMFQKFDFEILEVAA
jgi:hypothetical protein